MRSSLLAGRFFAFTVLLSLATLAAAQAPQTATDAKKGDAVVTTYELKGEVEYVEGNSLVVTMSSGEVRVFNVPESRRFLVDGKELTVHELVPGTKLTATVTTTTTPVTVRTVTVKSGKVWHVWRNNVILTLPNGENKQFVVDEDTPFTINGIPATVRDLKKGMVVSAVRVVEEPTTEITTDTRVVGQAPAPAPTAATEPTPSSAKGESAEPAPPIAQDAPAESAPPVVQAESAEPPPAPAGQAPATPKTASRALLIVGVLLVAGILIIWVLGRRKSGEASR